MKDYQRQFLEFALARQVLRFGEFTLKSGRKSPYFFNAGLFNTGASLAAIGRSYAQAVVESGIRFDMLFGPAYKGIPLAAVTAAALAEHHGRDLPYCFNRKEAKDHGEGGSVVGAPLRGRVLVIDDVITDGGAKREAIEFIRAAGATPCGVLIALDRQERGQGAHSATQELTRDYGVPVAAIATLADILATLERRHDGHEHVARIEQYRRQFGVAA